MRSDDFQPYDFAFTDSEQGIEILVGWKRGTFAQALYTQRREMQVGNLRLRPGGLLSVLEKNAAVFTNLLFLHTDSGTDAGAYQNRQTMFGKIWSLRRALAALPEQQGQPRLIALGDLNTTGRKNGPSAADEIAALEAQATQHRMRVLPKTHPHTWSSDGTKKSNLDHVIASTDLQFKPVPGTAAPAEVLVDGWVSRPARPGSTSSSTSPTTACCSRRAGRRAAPAVARCSLASRILDHPRPLCGTDPYIAPRRGTRRSGLSH